MGRVNKDLDDESETKLETRRSNRFRRNVSFYGNVVSFKATPKKRTVTQRTFKGKRKRIRNSKQKLNLSCASVASIESIYNASQEGEGSKTYPEEVETGLLTLESLPIESCSYLSQDEPRSQTSTSKEDQNINRFSKSYLLNILKKKGLLLLRKRCINKRTGENQIGVSKSYYRHLRDFNKHNQSFRSYTNLNSELKLQQDGVFETFSSTSQERQSGNRFIQEVCSKVLNDLNKFCLPCFKRKDYKNEDSKCYWF